MKCKACGSSMDLTETLGDGYIEPKEYIYKCECGVGYVEAQDGYSYWEKLPDKWIKEDGSIATVQKVEKLEYRVKIFDPERNKRVFYVSRKKNANFILEHEGFVLCESDVDEF